MAAKEHKERRELLTDRGCVRSPSRSMSFKSARGLAQSKTWRQFERASAFSAFLRFILFPLCSLCSFAAK
jgi:hypothetical protein